VKRQRLQLKPRFPRDGSEDPATTMNEGLNIRAHINGFHEISLKTIAQQQRDVWVGEPAHIVPNRTKGAQTNWFQTK